MSHPALEYLRQHADFTDLHQGGRYLIDLRYNGPNNFVGRDLYGEFNRAYLHREAATKLERAADLLTAWRADHRFVIFDALRPRSVQRVLWDEVVGTPNEQFLANPDLGSLHNYGFAVDLSIVDGAGRELDMGAGFDEFTARAQPKFEDQCLGAGEVTEAQLRDRHVLRDVMAAAGFKQLAHEWWHFDALTRDQARASFKIVE